MSIDLSPAFTLTSTTHNVLVPPKSVEVVFPFEEAYSTTMAEPSWSADTTAKSGGADATAQDITADRTALIAARLKEIYKKSVYPVEKKYNYDYFYESPLMTDVEFDGKCFESALCVLCALGVLLLGERPQRLL
jgi:hypothetical protein